MRNIQSVIQRKTVSPVSVSPSTSVVDALKLMAEKNIGSVIVMDNEKYMGIMTERDYSRKVILKGKNSNTTPVSEIMSTDLPILSPADSIESCMKIMTDKNIRYLPVFEGSQLTGIISMSDVVKETILNQKEAIEQLENYIHGS